MPRATVAVRAWVVLATDEMGETLRPMLLQRRTAKQAITGAKAWLRRQFRAQYWRSLRYVAIAPVTLSGDKRPVDVDLDYDP
jgi:hypothetical protein